MLMIRLARAGSKKRPFYHVVVAEKKCPRDGKFIERLGFYHPGAKGQSAPYRLHLEKIEDWLKKGAKASDTVKGLIERVRKNGNPEGVTTAA